MNEIAQGRLDVEIRRHGQVIRTWVLKRIADTPVLNDAEHEAASWFHRLPLDQRSRLVTDLARVNINGVNLFEIATGPVGVLFTKYPQVFEIPEPRQEVPQEDQDTVETKEYSILAVAGASVAGSSGPGWYHGWKSFEFDHDGPA